MRLEVNVDKKIGIGVIISVLIFAGVLFVVAYDQPIPNPGHGGDRVLVDVDGDPLNGAGEMTLQDAFDSGYATGAWLCFNDDAKQSCINATTDSGRGTNGFRVVNCVNPTPTFDPVVGRALRYNNGRWQFLKSDDTWANCADGSAMVVRAVGPF